MTRWYEIGVLLRFCLNLYYRAFLQLFWILSGCMKKTVWIEVVQGDLLTAYDLLTGHFHFPGDNCESYLDGCFPAQHGLGMAFINKIVGLVLHGCLSVFGPVMWTFWSWRSDRFSVDAR